MGFRTINTSIAYPGIIRPSGHRNTKQNEASNAPEANFFISASSKDFCHILTKIHAENMDKFLLLQSFVIDSMTLTGLRDER